MAFGDTPDVANALLALVLDGHKTATCWSVEDGPQTEPSKRFVVTDGEGNSRALIETQSLFQCRFNEVSEDFARREGEGDRSLSHWREEHERYFFRNGGYSPDMMLWCETFKLIEMLPG